MNHTHESNESQQVKRNISLLHQAEAGADDRITCAACARHTGRDCGAWRELKTSRGYAPEQDLPRRCEAFRPGRGDQDQRNGMQRWPTLNRRIEEQPTTGERRR